MGTISITRTLPGDPQELFTTIVTPSSWQEWFSIHRDFVGATPERLTAQDTLTSKVVLLGMSNEVEWTVAALEEPHRIVLEGRGQAGVRCTFTYSLEATDEGTEMTAGGEFSGPLITGMLAKALEKTGKQQLDRTLTQLGALASRN